MVYKRGHVLDEGKRIRLLDNMLVYNKLGDKDIVCLEDIVYQLYTCGKFFSECTRFLAVFKLHTPNGGYKNKRKNFCEGGDFGNREDYINDIIARMC
jgi:large subunit ribosomal protein L7e